MDEKKKDEDKQEEWGKGSWIQAEGQALAGFLASTTTIKIRELSSPFCVLYLINK